LGAREDQIPQLAEMALRITRLIRVNPRVPTLSDTVQLLKDAY